jgi:hypothetical protein
MRNTAVSNIIYCVGEQSCHLSQPRCSVGVKPTTMREWGHCQPREYHDKIVSGTFACASQGMYVYVSAYMEKVLCFLYSVIISCTDY